MSKYVCGETTRGAAVVQRACIFIPLDCMGRRAKLFSTWLYCFTVQLFVSKKKSPFLTFLTDIVNITDFINLNGGSISC